MEITLANIAEAAQIVSILDEVTLDLLAKEIHQWTYPWYCFEIEKEIEKGYQYIVKEEEVVIAVFSIKQVEKDIPFKKGTVKDFGSTDIKKDYYLYRIAVRPEFQGKQVGKAICRFVMELCKREGIRIFLDCYKGNETLNKFYEKAGFYYLGDMPEGDYQVSVYSFSPEDKALKNRVKNKIKEKKGTIRVTLAVTMCLLVLALVFGFLNQYKKNQITLRPGVTVGDYTYWLNETYVFTKVPLGLGYESVGKLASITRKDTWPVQNLEAVGLPDSCIGQEVLLGNQDNNILIFKEDVKKYLYFERFYDNQNYSNGFYQSLLKKCTRKKVVSIGDINQSYSANEAQKDGCLVYQEGKVSGQEYMDRFFKRSEKGKKDFLRIMSIAEEGTDNTFMDLFYDGKSFYLFYSEQTDKANLRYSYLLNLKNTKEASDNSTYIMLLSNRKDLTLDEIYADALSSQYVTSRPYHVLYYYYE